MDIKNRPILSGSTMLKMTLFAILLLAAPESGNSLWNPSPTCVTRRDVGQRWINAMISSCIVVATTITPHPEQPAVARNLPQDTGADRSAIGTVVTLIPIVTMRYTLSGCVEQLSLVPTTAAKSAAELTAILQNLTLALTNIPTSELAFKRVFDKYSDPVSYKQKYLDQNAFLVYYTKGFDGNDRPSIESDLPIKQTLQYGTRNEAWVAWEGFLAELHYSRTFVTTATSAISDPSELLDDLAKALQATQTAVDSYLSLAPLNDLEKATAEM